MELKRDLQNKTEAVERLESVENEVESLRQELSEVTSKLEVATKTLTKEQGKNKSAAQHNQVFNLTFFLGQKLQLSLNAVVPNLFSPKGRTGYARIMVSKMKLSGVWLK